MANNNPQTGANPGGNSNSGNKNQGAQPPKTQQPAKQQPTQQPTQFKLEDIIKKGTEFFANNDKAIKEVEKDFLVGYANIVTQERNGNINYNAAAVKLADTVHESYVKNILGVDLSSIRDSEKRSNLLATAAMMTGIDSLSLEKSFLKSIDGASVDIFNNYQSTLTQSLAQFNQRTTLYRIKSEIKGKESEVAKQLVATLPKQYQSKAADLYRVDPTRITQDILVEVMKRYSTLQQEKQKWIGLTNP